jgi:alpha-methylacyl-CoA racemase
MDLAAVRQLLLTADALIEGFRPGTLERLGLGPDSLLKENPRLVYGRVTGWGQTGPLKCTAGHDINFISVTGALAAIGPAGTPDRSFEPDRRLRRRVHVPGDRPAGCRDGRAPHRAWQVVDAAMCDGVVSLMTIVHEMAAHGEWVEEREANIFDGGAPYNGIYECADGKHLSIGPIEAPFFVRLCNAIGLAPPPDREEEGELARPALDARRNFQDPYTRRMGGPCSSKAITAFLRC